MRSAAEKYESALGNTKQVPSGSLADLNRTLYSTERAFRYEAGLPRRDWFKHLIYAPGFYTGYGVKTLPGVREAIEQAQYQSLPAEIARVAKALEREAAWLDGITRDLRGLK